MKCPKCGYLGFETRGRCRNCGYDFSLSPAEPAAFDFALQPDLEPLISDADLPLATVQNSLGSTLPRTGKALDRHGLDLDRLFGEPAAPASELSLFGDAEEPLISTPPKPRPPLAVRRATPEIPRARLKVPRALEETLFEPAPASRATASPQRSSDVVASRARRSMAALLDVVLLLSVDVAVVYLTLRLCGLPPAELWKLPLVPLGAFFLLLNGGYSVAFTAVGGQSIGKMAAGIKVVGQEDRPVAFGRAALRTLGYFASALPLGAGFLPGLLGGDRLALHDRLAHTRVVRPDHP